MNGCTLSLAERLNTNVLHLLENNVSNQGGWHYINTWKNIKEGKRQQRGLKLILSG